MTLQPDSLDLAADTAPDSWAARADRAQDDIDRLFGAPDPQFMNNEWPLGDAGNAVFNYWWLAHLVDARVDAFERTGDPNRLAQARRALDSILERNGQSLFNDYFDDMLWLALAALRLHGSTGDDRHLTEAARIWQHVVDEGWNEHGGPSVAWRKQQPRYKNTPANAPFIILSARLARVDPGNPGYERYARAAFEWLTHTLVDPSTGFVEDGINREDDGAIDRHWRFTYSQGLYAGAALEMRTWLGPDMIETATRTLLTAIDELSSDGVFRNEGDGGDEGLFKGVYFRYAGLVLRHLDPASDAAGRLTGFIRESTDQLWRNHCRSGHLVAADDWADGEPQSRVYLSTQLSAVMATEQRARIDP